jgi:hypothetical protein
LRTTPGSRTRHDDDELVAEAGEVEQPEQQAAGRAQRRPTGPAQSPGGAQEGEEPGAVDEGEPPALEHQHLPGDRRRKAGHRPVHGGDAGDVELTPEEHDRLSGVVHDLRLEAGHGAACSIDARG